MQLLKRNESFFPGIYKIINLVNDKFYIGSSKNIYHRTRRHYSDLKKGKHHNSILQNSFYKYQAENFKIEILESCTIEDLLNKEIYWINLLKPEYNITKDITRNNISKESRIKAAKTFKERYKQGIIKPYRQDHAWIKIYQYTKENKFVAEYNCIEDAAKAVGCKASNIRNCFYIKNRVFAKGFKWSKRKLD